LVLFEQVPVILPAYKSREMTALFTMFRVLPTSQ